MNTFKTFLKILNKNKALVILYTVILIGFGASNMKTNDKSMNFVASKPDVAIVCEDEKIGITADFISYIEKHSNVKEIDTEELEDALFYRDVNMIIYIPKNYRTDFLMGKDPHIQIKSTGDYQASLENMLVTRYLQVSSIYQKSLKEESKIIEKVNYTLDSEAKVEILSKLDANELSKATYYYNFASYSILACLILVISLLLSSFNSLKIRKRIIVSKTDIKAQNRILYLSNCCYSLLLWAFFVVISFLLVGKTMFSTHGLLYIINSFVLSFVATSMAFFIGNLIQNKNAISGLVNVIALGSSFLCGAFVPMEWLPDSVLKIAHVIPTYYYTSNNELIKTLEIIQFETLKPYFINILIMIIFAIIFIVLANETSKRKRKIG